MSKEQKFAIEIVDGGGRGVVYATVDGLRVAKRPPRKGWISLEPGWTVRGAVSGNVDSDIVFEYDPKAARPQ